MSRVRDRRVPDVALRVWTPLGAQIGFVKQSLPEIADLSDRGVAVNERESDYPTGAWGDESRDYHLQICVPAHTVGERMLAGRVKLVVDGEVVSQTNIDVTWSEDEHLTTKKHKAVRDTELRQQYAELTTEMLDARHDGDIDKATERAERMRDIAQQLHDLDKVELVDRFVDVDPETGRVTPKANVDKLDELDAATRSVKTNRTKRPEVPNDPGSEP